MYQIPSCYICRFICTCIYPARSLFTLNRSPMLVGPSHPRTTSFDVAFSTPFSVSAQNALSLSLYSLSFSLSPDLFATYRQFSAPSSNTHSYRETRGRYGFCVENFAKRHKNESAHRAGESRRSEKDERACER